MDWCEPHTSSSTFSDHRPNGKRLVTGCSKNTVVVQTLSWRRKLSIYGLTIYRSLQSCKRTLDSVMTLSAVWEIYYERIFPQSRPFLQVFQTRHSFLFIYFSFSRRSDSSLVNINQDFALLYYFSSLIDLLHRTSSYYLFIDLIFLLCFLFFSVSGNLNWMPVSNGLCALWGKEKKERKCWLPFKFSCF